SKTAVGQKYNCSMNVTVVNDGESSETFNVAIYSNGTQIWTQIVNNLPIGGVDSLTYSWNTTGHAYGTYNMTAFALPVLGENYIGNNNMTTYLNVTIPGDINGDFNVNLPDLTLLANAYGTTPASGGIAGAPRAWNPNADIDCNNVVGLTD